MEPFKIHILGCGSALPTLRHNPSAQVVELRGKQFMIDCGEGTQTQMRRQRIGFNKVVAIFISHIHGDHCFGLIGMLSSFGLLGRTMPLAIYAPKEFKPVLDMMLKTFCYDFDYEIQFHAVDTTKQQVIYEDRSLTVESIPLKHRLPTCGFLFREKPTLPHIRRDMIDFYRIPVSQINNIKNGASWTDEEGRLIPNERLTMPADKPRSYAYCSDTIYLPALHERIAGVSCLYHESTYTTADADRAEMYFHSTAAQAAQVARDANAGRLLLGHYSSKYDDERQLLKEAQEVFAQSQLTNEGMTIDLK
ncbi:ribonuclease Z [Prevotella sp.]|uniref:ribonuclease Z n=1 Tax=uncultured Prevotella sp. TaxID=159272 RepID=UPI0025F8725E|nr:ribonuclease Z [Prevotella sp.]MCI7118431.1 ribonuclease Z [Prevotella sp.]